MKKLIIGVICLFLVIPCFALDVHMEHVVDQLNVTIHGNSRYGYKLDKKGSVFGGVVKLGIASWGFSQENAYGNVTGSLFALSGIIQIVAIRW